MGVTGLVSHEPTLPESSGHEDKLTEAQLSERAGTPPDQVRLLVELGVLRPEQGIFRSRDLVRLRVLDDLRALGVDARSVAKALSSGYLSLGYLENSALKPPQSELSFSQLAAELAIPFSTLEKLYIACGLGHPSPKELVRAQDVPIIRAVPVLFGARVSEGECFAPCASGQRARGASLSIKSTTSTTRLKSRFGSEASATTKHSRRRSAR